MSTGSTLNRIEAQLEQLRASIRQAQLDLLGGGEMPAVDDPDYHDFWQRLAGFGEQLRMVVGRDLASIDSLLGVQAQASWKLPRLDPRRPQPGGSPRFRERARIESHRRRHGEVYRKAIEIEAALRKLYHRGQTPTNKDVIEHLHELLTGLEEHMSEIDASALSRSVGVDGYTFEAPVAGGPPAVPFSVVLTIIFAYILSKTR
jgi:hypothetical protein